MYQVQSMIVVNLAAGFVLATLL